MITLTELFDTDLLNDMIELGYVKYQCHPTAPLVIYNYSHKAQYDRAWNDVTKKCRGLIVNSDTGEVVARPLEKFFNLGEHDENDPTLTGPFTIANKLDGSLGIIYPLTTHEFGNECDEWAVATRGSFTSPQAIKATEMLKDYQFDIPPGCTLLVEIIYPQNRIVVDYGKEEKLVAIASIYNKTGGNYSSLPGVICDPYEEGEPLAVKWSGEVTPTSVANFNPASVLARAGAEVPGDPNGDEGYVLQFTNSGVRVKVKFDEYVRLHRILTNVSARTLWSLLVENKPVDDVLDKVPDEFYNWVRDTVAELKTNFKALFGQVTQSYDVLYEEIRGTTDRERRANFANLVKNNKYKGLMFSLYDGKDISEKVWLMVKPEHSVPFKKDDQDG